MHTFMHMPTHMCMHMHMHMHMHMYSGALRIWGTRQYACLHTCWCNMSLHMSNGTHAYVMFSGSRDIDDKYVPIRVDTRDRTAVVATCAGGLLRWRRRRWQRRL